MQRSTSRKAKYRRWMRQKSRKRPNHNQPRLLSQEGRGFFLAVDSCAHQGVICPQFLWITVSAECPKPAFL